MGFLESRDYDMGILAKIGLSMGLRSETNEKLTTHGNGPLTARYW